jgi:hypothetical protein
LINNPESTIRSLLDFLEEPYAARCLEPLELRINSSTVSTDSETDDTAASPGVVDEAMQLSAEVERTSQPAEASSAAADEMEAAFRERVRYVATLDTAYQAQKSRLESMPSAHQSERSIRDSGEDRTPVPA